MLCMHDCCYLDLLPSDCSQQTTTRCFVPQRTEDKSKNQAPTKTLFVVNFDVLRTRVRDIEDLFVKYGPLSRVEIKRNYAFVEFESLDDAIKAQRDTDTTQWNGRTLTVEFVTNKDGPSKSGAPRNRYEEVCFCIDVQSQFLGEITPACIQCMLASSAWCCCLPVHLSATCLISSCTSCSECPQ